MGLTTMGFIAFWACSRQTQRTRLLMSTRAFVSLRSVALSKEYTPN